MEPRDATESRITKRLIDYGDPCETVADERIGRVTVPTDELDGSGA